MKFFNDCHRMYAIIFTFSLFLFLINFLIQGKILFTYSDVYGLIFKLNWPFWLGYLVLLILILYHFSKFEKIDENFVFLTIFLLMIYLIGTPFFLEHLPRFEDSWSHSFVSQQIFKNEKVKNGITIYEEYPGSFLFYGLLFKLLPTYDIMKIFPPIFYIVGISATYLITKNLVNKKTAFLTSILYIFFNWTVEDNHLSPQFLMLNMYFLFMLILIKYLKESKNRKNYFIVLILFTLAITFSHPLTPIFLIFILGSILIICKKLRRAIIPIFILVAITFFIYETFETTMLVDITKFFKDFIEILTLGRLTNPVARFTGLDFLYRKIILGSKVSIILFSVILGSFGVITLYKEKYSTEAKFFFAWAFALVPLMIFLGQVIHGEFYERFALISSFPLAFLTSYFLIKTRIKTIYILIILLILSPLYFFGKYGNEAYESQSQQKLKVDCYSYIFNSNCEKNNQAVTSWLNLDIELLGSRHAGTTREEVMAISITKNLDVESIFHYINMCTSKNRIDRLYSTNEAAAYAFIR